MACKYKKRYFISLHSRVVQNKTTMSHYYISAGKAKMKNIEIPTVGKDVEQLLYIAGGNIKCYSCFEN